MNYEVFMSLDDSEERILMILENITNVVISEKYVTFYKNEDISFCASADKLVYFKKPQEIAREIRW